MKFQLFILCFVGFLVISCQHESIAPDGEFFSGKVISAVDGSPLANIGISVNTNLQGQYGGPEAKEIAATDKNGNFQISFTDTNGGWHSLGINGYLAYDPQFTSMFFTFRDNESQEVEAILHPYTALKINAVNVNAENANKKVYISTNGDFCWCTELETDRAIGHGETVIDWFLEGDEDVISDTIYTFADQDNSFQISY